MDMEERIKALEQKIEYLDAIEGIRSTISHYAQSLDFARWEELASLLTDDVVHCNRTPFGSWFEDVQGKENVINRFRKYRSAYQHPKRFTTNERFQVEGNTATCFAYFLVFHSSGVNSYLGWGTYDWSFRLEEGTWKFSKMVHTVHTMTSPQAGWAMERLEDRVVPFPPPSSS